MALCLFCSLQMLHYLVTLTVFGSEKLTVQFYTQVHHIPDDVIDIWCSHWYHSWYLFDSIYNNDKDNQVVWHIFHLFIFLIDFMMSSHDHYTRSSKKMSLEDAIANLQSDFKKLFGPFLWMGFNYLKARDTSRRQFTFYH